MPLERFWRIGGGKKVLECGLDDFGLVVFWREAGYAIEINLILNL
jgi:hypothetical protein